MKKIFSVMIILLIISCTGCFNTGNDSSNRVEEIVNKISQETVKSSVTVTATCITNDVIFSREEKYLGSGVVYEINEQETFIITNSHVVAPGKYDYIILKVFDYLETEYDATLIKNDVKNDLAIIKIENSQNELIPVTMSDKEAELLDKVICLTAPHGQRNAITFGYIKGIELVNVTSKDEQADYKSIIHNAFIANGSSGGALYNYELELIGLNYAGSESDEGKFIQGCAIPIGIIIEFIS